MQRCPEIPDTDDRRRATETGRTLGHNQASDVMTDLAQEGVVVLRSIGLGLALMAFSGAADEGVECCEGRAEMIAKAAIESLRTLTGLFAQPAPDQAGVTTVVIGFRG